MKLFLDTNILLDYLLERENFSFARSLFLLGITKQLTLFASTAQANDLLYVLGGRSKNGISKNYKQALIKMTSFINFVPLSSQNFKDALTLNWKDAEDACAYEVAKSVGADVIISRDEKGFANSSIPVMSAKAWLEGTKEQKSNEKKREASCP